MGRMLQALCLFELARALSETDYESAVGEQGAIISGFWISPGDQLSSASSPFLPFRISVRRDLEFSPQSKAQFSRHVDGKKRSCA